MVVEGKSGFRRNAGGLTYRSPCLGQDLRYSWRDAGRCDNRPALHAFERHGASMGAMLMAMSWGHPVGGIRIGARVSPPKGTVLQLVIGIKNGSANTQGFVRTAPLADYDIRVTNSAGVAVPISSTGQLQTSSSVDNAHFRRILVSLPPNKTREERYDLTSLFALRPGRYK